MSTRAERETLKRFYGKNWSDKIDKMSDSQIIAIYRKFQREGKIK